MHHRDIFLAALDLPAPERGAYLDRACADDAELRRLVEELLLSHDEAGSFLEHPAVTDQTRTVGEGVATPEAGAATETGAAPADDLSFLAPSPVPGCLGRLGYYDVREMVGRGGMGVVLKAVDTKLQRVVAIKVLAPQLAASGTARRRFLREAHAAAAVRDDHVVGIYAVGDEGPVPYLVMEYIAGITLDDRIKQGGPLDVKEVLRIGMQVARGLAAAHAQGLIHRDIKPANILLENGVQRVKITDFGLARAADDASLTQSGVIAGTPMFMSPEQAEGRAVDARTDLFSLGSVLYAMCTGRPPFRAESTMAVLKRVCEETPRPIREINPDVPDWLAAIVMKLLAKDPAQRFQSAAEVAELLGQYLAHVQQPHLVARPPSVAATKDAARRREQSVLRGVRAALVAMVRFNAAVSLPIAVLGLLLAVWFAVQLLRDRGNQVKPANGPADDRGEKDKPPFRPLTPEELAKLPSPLDGRKRDDIRPDLLALAGGGDPAQAPPELVAVLGDGRFVLPGEGLTSWMAQSADGKLLAVPRGSNVVLFDAGTGAVVRTLVGPGGRMYNAAFSPDGTRLVGGTFHGAGSVAVWDVQTGRVVHVLKGHTGVIWRTAFSGDGRRFVSVSSDKTAKVWDAEKGVELFTLRGHQDEIYTGAFNPDGRWVLTGSKDGTVKVWDARTGQESKTLPGNGLVFTLAYSPDGRLLAGGGILGWKLWDAKTFEEVRSKNTAADCNWLAFSADSRALLTGRHINTDGTAHAVVRWDLTTGDMLGTLPLKSAGGYALYALSPDAKTLFAMGTEPPDPFVRSYDAETGKERPRQGHAGQVWTVAFSPDGKTLASAGEDRIVRLWDLGGWKPGEPLPPARQLTGHTGAIWSAAFSPDGKRLATGGFDGAIIVWNVAGGYTEQTLPTLATDSSRVAFSPDGKTLAGGQDDGSVRRWDVATWKEQPPLRWHTGVVIAVAFSPDGRFLASKGRTDETVCLGDAVTGQVLHKFRNPGPFQRPPEFTLEFSPDSRTLVFGGEKDVRLGDVETKKEVRLGTTAGWLHSVAFHPGGRLLASAAAGEIRFWDRSAPGRLLTLEHEGHGAWVRDVAFDPTGRYLATANWNGTIWVLRTPEPPKPYEPAPRPLPDAKELAAKPAAADALKRDNIHPGLRKGLPPEVVGVLGGPAFALPQGKAGPMAVSADGKRLAVPCENKVVIFDAQSGRHLRTLTDPIGRISCVVFSPDGKRLAAACWNENVYNVRIWDTESGEAGVCFAGHTAVVQALAFSRDGKRLVSASSDGTARVWAKVWNGSDDLILSGNKSAVYSAAFSPDGKRVVTGGADKTVRVWDAETGKPMKVLEGHSGDVASVAFSPDGKLLASGSWEEWKLWDADTLKEVRSANRTPAEWLTFAPDGQSLWAGGHKVSIDPPSHHVLTRWGLDVKRLASFDLGGDGGLAFYALSPDGRTFYVSADHKGNTLRTYDAATGAERAPQGHAGKLIAAAVSPDGALLASAGEDSLVKLWDLATGELKQTLRGHAGKVRGVAFSPDGKRLASQGEDGTLRLWDPARGTEAEVLARGKADGWGVAFSPDGKQLASSSQSDGGVYLWDVAGAQLVRVFRGHHAAIRLAFSPDGRLLACGGSDATVRVWDVAGGWQVRELRGPGPMASSVGFSPDGRSLAAGCDDGTVKQWDVVTGAEVGSPWKFAGPVQGTAFGPDGRLIAASSWDGTVRLRDLTAQPPRDRTVRLPAGCENLVFTPEGRYLAVPCHDGSVYVLRLADRGKVFEVVDR